MISSPSSKRPPPSSNRPKGTVRTEVLQKIATSVQCNEVEELQSRLIEESFFHAESPRCLKRGATKTQLFLRIPKKRLEKPKTSEFWCSFVEFLYSAFSTSLDWLEPPFCFQKTRRCRSWRSQDMAEDSYVLEASNKKLSGMPKFYGDTEGRPHFHDLHHCITSFFWKNGWTFGEFAAVYLEFGGNLPRF